MNPRRHRNKAPPRTLPIHPEGHPSVNVALPIPCCRTATSAPCDGRATVIFRAAGSALGEHGCRSARHQHLLWRGRNCTAARRGTACKGTSVRPPVSRSRGRGQGSTSHGTEEASKSRTSTRHLPGS
uniref:Uncharacterized protein n=1 Tax=Setaria viridis TaxID=4556 RepID=A0A4U6V9X5_SETVI|nr:hypothetical protein SEVIR_3G083700v2 [Setaria viridis]